MIQAIERINIADYIFAIENVTIYRKFVCEDQAKY